jgi:hypothetical protein
LNTPKQSPSKRLNSLEILQSNWNASWLRHGLDPGSLAQSLKTRDGLAGLLDYVCQDESLLLAFCETANLQPREPLQALALLQKPASTGAL